MDPVPQLLDPDGWRIHPVPLDPAGRPRTLLSGCKAAPDRTAQTPEGETINALEIGAEHAGRFVEFTTVATEEHEAAGLGALGETITVEGWLLAVVNGDTAGTRWTRMRVAVHDECLRKTEITGTLGANRAVTLRPN